MRRWIVGLGVLILALALSGTAAATSVYYDLGFQDLKITAGQLPSEITTDTMTHGRTWWRNRERIEFLHPYAIGNAGEEMYVSSIMDSGAFSNPAPRESLTATLRVAVCVSGGQPPSGRLFLPKPDWSGLTPMDFTVAATPGDQATAGGKFFHAKEEYYLRLLRMGIPGAAWFRHQVREAEIALGEKPDKASPDGRERFPRQSWDSSLEQTYSLFTGGRALSENLQLDRTLTVSSPTSETVSLQSIEGITTTPIDWKALVKDMKPGTDTLAQYIPADQHALFFPSFQAMTALLDEADARGTPILNLLEPRSEDARTSDRYQRQLCMPRDALSRLLGPKLIASVAFTGSDPYLRTGTDVAVLFEAVDSALLDTSLAARQKEASAKFPDAKPLTGKVGEVAYNGVMNPDRSICSYRATLGKVVAVSNSLVQLERIVQVAKGKVPALSSQDEYTWFRHRYPRGDAEETAFLVLTDATIRRWCSPPWRIGASRRTRAAAVLAEFQADSLDGLAAGRVNSARLDSPGRAQGLGEVTLTSKGPKSSIYGTLDFLTPIAELQFNKVTPEEQRAYDWFRQNYQSSWRRYFDPIAAKFTAKPNRVAVDITVRPLIAGTEYREFMELTGNAAITPGAGDPHPESMLHLVLSLNPESQLVRQAGNFAIQMAPGLEANALNWIGKWITMYVDEDPFWAELEKAVSSGGEDALEQYMKRRFTALPVGVAVEVSSAFKLTAFLTAARAFIEQTSPGMTSWEALTYNDVPYVKVSPSTAAKKDMGEDEPKDLAVYYAATPKALILTLNENLLKRALDRISTRRKAAEEGKPAPAPDFTWMGRSVALHARSTALPAAQALYEDDLQSTFQRRSWGNLMILNEWHRRFGQPSPVDFHEQFWHTWLLDPAGGDYVWNEECRTFESTTYGCPAQPKRPTGAPDPLAAIATLNLGLTFEGDGLRAQGELVPKPRP